MVYLVEDDESIRELVVYTLNSQGLEAEGFEVPSAFWKAVEKKNTGYGSPGYYASRGRRSGNIEKIKEAQRYKAASYCHVDCKGQ